MRVAMWGNDTGSKYWRLVDPAKYLQTKGIDAVVIDGPITDEIAQQADVFVLNSIVDKSGIALLHYYQKEFGKKIVVDMDDYLEVNPDSPFKIEHQISDAPIVRKVCMEIADLVTCTTDYLAEKCQESNPKVTVLPNFMDMERWDLPKQTNHSDTIRIGWAGSVTHLDDLKMIVKPLKRICKEFPKVKLIFVGEARIAEELKDYPVEIVLGVPFEVWPTRLQGLQLDIGLAPLRDTEFNRCKSRIKFYEYSIAQVPGVYSPTVYKERVFDGKFGMIAETEDQWYRAIKNLIISKNLREDIAASAYAHVMTWCDLKKNINLWVKAYRKLFDVTPS